MRHKDFETFYNNRNAPLEHLFNSHTYCDPSWCWAKELDDELFKHINEQEKKTMSKIKLTMQMKWRERKFRIQ